MVESLIDPLLDKIYSAPFEVRTRRSINPAHPLAPYYSLETQGTLGTAVEPSAATAQSAANTTLVTILQNMINGATISAVCNGDGTITVTLNWGS